MYIDLTITCVAHCLKLASDMRFIEYQALPSPVGDPGSTHALAISIHE